jgi:hypothetical protein
MLTTSRSVHAFASPGSDEAMLLGILGGEARKILDAQVKETTYGRKVDSSDRLVRVTVTVEIKEDQ